MAYTPDAREFQGKLQRLDELIREAERLADPSAQAQIRETVQAILELHGAGLERLLGHLSGAGEAGEAVLAACVDDEVVGGLLLLHGLHPKGLETRVGEALEGVRPYLRSHGGNVELLGVTDGVVRLRLVGSCHGCPSSAVTMTQTIEEAILARAPDATAVEVEGVTEAPAVLADGRVLISLPVLPSV